MRPTYLSSLTSTIYKILVIIAPFLRPANGVGDTPPLPYYLSVLLTRGDCLIQTILFWVRYCLVGIAVMALGIIYWAVWRIVLPKIFGYELVLNKVVLDDGTVVNVVRFSSVIFLFFVDLWLTIYLFLIVNTLVSEKTNSEISCDICLCLIMVMLYRPCFWVRCSLHSESSYT